ncbi:hypothetical protein [Pedobacter agri]|uniref:Uncharacterized protein n=1 Tax=Pedobacter agri TaxID=454586 RepID=A0A9X3DHL4_9SPHI|nr:hypothetical protein [Pedobacter agri]MCX3267457.1 hypothetical protein [Pedobacter agri]MDQ1142857.1 hypothetical protein [Pedobacter agri]
MERKISLKWLGIVPFVLYLLATQLFDITTETKIIILSGVIVLGIASLVFNYKALRQNNNYKMFVLFVAAILTIGIFLFQYIR